MSGFVPAILPPRGARSNEPATRGPCADPVYPAPIVVVDASADPETVFNRIETAAALESLSRLRGRMMAWHNLRGHDRVVESLRSAPREGRFPHALFFAGPEGIGKHTFARKLAQALLCETRPRGGA